MREKFYKRKIKIISAIQYDGTDECKEDFLMNYSQLHDNLWDGLYADIDYDDVEITEGDWLLLDKGKIISVVRRDDFEDNYEPI